MDKLLRGSIPNTKIEFIEVVKYNTNTEKGRWQVNFDDLKVGELIATGNAMCNSEFILTSNKKILSHMISSFKDKANISNPQNVLSFEENFVLYDTDEVAAFEKEGLKILDEDLFAFFINEMTAEVKNWEER